MCLGYSDDEETYGGEWNNSRSDARFYQDTWEAPSPPPRTPWRTAHIQPDLLLAHTPSPHRRSATDPNIAGLLRPPPPRRRLPPTPQQPSNLNIDQLHPIRINRSPTLPGLLSETDLSINFPKLSRSPSHKHFVDFPPLLGMIPSTLPRLSVPARRTLPAPLPGWAGLEEAVQAGRGSRMLPVVVQPRPGVGPSPSRGQNHRTGNSEDEEEDWC